MFKCEFKTENAAFNDSPDSMQSEVAAILRQVAQQVERGATGGGVRDANGNMVGTWSLKS